MAAATQKLTFAEHIQELRKRLMWSLFFVAIGAGAGYALHSAILRLLQKPLSSSLYYTAPTGAFSFIIKVCVVFGFIVALPMVVYQIFAFFGPLLPKKTKKSIVAYVFVSVLLACAGITFAYLVSLPAALHFLVNFGSDGADIQAIITADEYFNFVLAYIAGFAVLFQLPLIVSFINRVTPLKPSQLLGGTRYVVLGSFVVAGIITPTPDPLNQGLMAGPIILLYFVSVAVVATMNVRKRPKQSSFTSESEARDVQTVLADVDSLRAEQESIIPATPQPQVLPRPATVESARPRTHIPVRRRLVTDMVVSGRADVSRSLRPVRQVPSSPDQATVQKQQSDPPIRVISDFIPASE